MTRSPGEKPHLRINFLFVMTGAACWSRATNYLIFLRAVAGPAIPVKAPARPVLSRPDSGLGVIGNGLPLEFAKNSADEMTTRRAGLGLNSGVFSCFWTGFFFVSIGLLKRIISIY
jgi:hypothetical protein